MKTKHLIIGGLVIALSACSDDSTPNTNSGNDNTITTTYSTASYTVGQWDQTRTDNLGTWSDGTSHDNHDWQTTLDGLSFTAPDGAVDITVPGHAQSNTYFVPASFNGQLDLGNINQATELYIYGTVTYFSGNANGKLTVYNSGEVNWSIQTGGRNHVIYNAGTLNIWDYSCISAIYNKGELILDRNQNPWWPNEGARADVPNDLHIYSKDGSIHIPVNADFKATCDIHDLITADGDLYIQNSTTKYVCGLEVNGDITLPDVGIQASYIKANTITFNGHPINLLPEGHVIAEKIIFANSGCTFLAHEGSYGLVDVKDIEFRDNRNFENSFGLNVYANVTGTITQDKNGQRNTYTADTYPASDNEKQILNTGIDISGAPACGPNYGTVEPSVPTGPRLILIAEVEAPDHDHNADKTNGNRHLSATCIDYNNGVFYTSYHMRGGNYANDTYDKDDVEGCIETWTLNDVTTDGVTQKKLQLGKYMWTYDFDFNHILYDNGSIIVVGHKDGYKDGGAIIGRIADTFANFNPDYIEGPSTSSEFQYKHLKTEVPVMGDSKVEGKGQIIVDYENAGDGNCVIKVGDNYYVATFAGYGIVDSEFNRVRLGATETDKGDIAFVSTPGSAKHIIPTGNNDFAVLHLNTRPANITAETSSPASIVTFTGTALEGAATTIDGLVQPVDGKNVLAWDGANLYACLGKGGLNINNTTTLTFGENGGEPVNGVAIDDEYIYVACGSHLRVLDINTQAEIATFHLKDVSANYIKVVEQDGVKYIAVAFGQDGIKVFTLEV